MRARLRDFQISDADWENFALPINLAFFFYSTPNERTIALYPESGRCDRIAPPLTGLGITR